MKLWRTNSPRDCKKARKCILFCGFAASGNNLVKNGKVRGKNGGRWLWSSSCRKPIWANPPSRRLVYKMAEKLRPQRFILVQKSPLCSSILKEARTVKKTHSIESSCFLAQKWEPPSQCRIVGHRRSNSHVSCFHFLFKCVIIWDSAFVLDSVKKRKVIRILRPLSTIIKTSGGCERSKAIWLHKHILRKFYICPSPSCDFSLQSLFPFSVFSLLRSQNISWVCCVKTRVPPLRSIIMLRKSSVIQQISSHKKCFFSFAWDRITYLT